MSPTSQPRNMPSAPDLLSSSTTGSESQRLSGVGKSFSRTLKPAFASVTQHARPIPRIAPVTIAVGLSETDSAIAIAPERAEDLHSWVTGAPQHLLSGSSLHRRQHCL